MARKLPIAIFSLQLLFVIIFSLFTKYGLDIGSDPSCDDLESCKIVLRRDFDRNYPMFQDINSMIFLGIGCLYAFLRKYSYCGMGMNFLLCAISVQWGIITQNVFHMVDMKMEINLISIIYSEFAAASAVIALGGLFGKVNVLQMIVFTLLEVLAYSTVDHLCKTYLQVSDVGESVALHLFAAIFGCAAAFAADFKKSVSGNPNETHSYVSNAICMIGTLVLWIFWPSFNSAVDEGVSQHRSVVNTFLALIGSSVSCFAMSALLHNEGKFTMSHIQNGALAGAVGVGATSNLVIQPFGALLIGVASGCICVAGFKYFTPFLEKMNIYDPCGINSLHGLPGLFAGIIGIFLTYFANEAVYGSSLYKFYPAMAPMANTTELQELYQRFDTYSIAPGLGRSHQSQALYQLIYILAVTVASTVTGLITGAVIRLKIFGSVKSEDMYDDKIIWDLSDIETKK